MPNDDGDEPAQGDEVPVGEVSSRGEPNDELTSVNEKTPRSEPEVQ